MFFLDFLFCVEQVISRKNPDKLPSFVLDAAWYTTFEGGQPHNSFEEYLLDMAEK